MGQRTPLRVATCATCYLLQKPQALQARWQEATATGFVLKAQSILAPI